MQMHPVNLPEVRANVNLYQLIQKLERLQRINVAKTVNKVLMVKN